MTFDEWVTREKILFISAVDANTCRLAWSASREETIEEMCVAIRKNCGACGGSGGYGGGVHVVTHDMASDAGEPEMEGMEIVEPPNECEYCGYPVAVIRALKDKKPQG